MKVFPGRAVKSVEFGIEHIRQPVIQAADPLKADELRAQHIGQFLQLFKPALGVKPGRMPCQLNIRITADTVY